MEQQISRIGHNQLPPPFLTRAQPLPKSVEQGGSKRPPDGSHPPTVALPQGKRYRARSLPHLKCYP